MVSTDVSASEALFQPAADAEESIKPSRLRLHVHEPPQQQRVPTAQKSSDPRKIRGRLAAAYVHEASSVLFNERWRL